MPRAVVDRARRPALAARLRAVKAVAFDVDGVLTDGRLYFGDQSERIKSFSVTDGLGLTWLRQSGLKLAIISGRASKAVAARAQELGFDHVQTGQNDKAAGLRALAEQWGLGLSDFAYMGDDWPDWPAMQLAGVSATTALAPLAMRRGADWVAKRPGGEGAAREFSEWLLKQRGALPAVLAQYQLAKNR